LINKLKTYKDAYKKIKDEHNNCENKVIESDLSFQISFKELVKGHESLKIELELKKNEIKYLKNQVSDLEKNEKILKSMLVTKKVIIKQLH
jgi:polyhydroxyalkanoate synthesis regulator phasin